MDRKRVNIVLAMVAVAGIFALQLLFPTDVIADPVVNEPGYSIEMVASGLGAATGIAIAPTGDILLTDYGGRILSIDKDTYAVTTYAIGFSYSTDLAFDSSGRLFVLSGSGSPRNVYQVFPDGTNSFFSGGFSYSVGMIADGIGNLYLGNSGDGTISKVDSLGVASTYLSGYGGPNGPFGLTLDDVGNLYFVQHGEGFVYKSTPAKLVSLLADLPNFGPTFIEVDNNGTLYVSDSLSSAIWKIVGTDVTLFASGFSGKSNPPVIGPQDLIFDQSGNLFVADGNYLWKISPPVFSCEGFEYPMDQPFTLVGSKKGRIFPLGMSLIDESSSPIINSDITSPPVVQVDFADTFPDPLPYSTSAPRGEADEGNQFIFRNGEWELNIPAKNYSAPGTYTIRAITGDTYEYTINPTCEATFVIPQQGEKKGKGPKK